MAKSHKVERPFTFFGWDEPHPCGKYKQPKANDAETGSGYPAKGIDNDNVLVKGRWPSGTKKKRMVQMKGTGAAERGTRFHENDKKFSYEE